MTHCLVSDLGSMDDNTPLVNAFLTKERPLAVMI